MQRKNLRDVIPLRLLYIKLGTTQLQEELFVSFYTTTCFGLFSGHHKVINLQLHKRTCYVEASSYISRTQYPEIKYFIKT